MKKLKRNIAILFTVLGCTLGIGGMGAWATPAGPSPATGKAGDHAAPAMHLFIDTHDKRDGSFPASITNEQLHAFYAGYAKAMQSHGVVVLRTYVNPRDGRAFCLTMAPSAEAVRKAHVQAGLMYNGITEVYGVAPSDLLLNE